jgi:dephospho-CoA kinase
VARGARRERRRRRRGGSRSHGGGAARARRDPRALRRRGPDGTLDRAALARLVFSDAAALRDLEAIVHPAVRPRILAAIQAADAAGARAVVIEAIKLVEGGLAALCDETWLVTCTPDEQRARLAGRGVAPDDAARRIAAQADIAARFAAAATRIVDTGGERAAAEARTAAAYAAALAADKHGNKGR